MSDYTQVGDLYRPRVEAEDWWRGSHLELLLAACQRTTGPIIELGVGYYSTVQLHVDFPDRIIYSVESNAEWLHRYASKLATPRHLFLHVTDYTAWLLPVPRAGVLFVDGLPAEQRRLCVRKFADQADIIVAHDTEPSCAPIYAWGDCFDNFKYRWTDTKHERWTTAVSNTHENLSL